MSRRKKKPSKTPLVLALIVIALLLGVIAFLLSRPTEDNTPSNKDTSEVTTENPYAGYQFVGKDPWGDDLYVTIRTYEDGYITWTFTDQFAEGMIYSELGPTAIVQDNSGDFSVDGEIEDMNATYHYDGVIKLVDGHVEISFVDGAVTTNSEEGGSASRQVGPLDEASRTVVLQKN